MYGLTRRQHELLEYVRKYVGIRGYSPSYLEMMDAIGLSSKSGVHRLVKSLRDRGHIATMPGIKRSIVLVTRQTHETRPPPAERADRTGS